MSRKSKPVVIPRLPRPPGQTITPHYVDQLVAALEGALDALQAVQRKSFTAINLTNTPENGANLRTGDVFSDDGILKIVRANEAFAATFVGTTAIGTVTVSTP